MNFTVEQAKKIAEAYNEWLNRPKSLMEHMNQRVFGDDTDQHVTGPTWAKWGQEAIEFTEAYEKAVQEEVERRLDEGVSIVPTVQENGDSGQSEEPDTNNYDDDYA